MKQTILFTLLQIIYTISYGQTSVYIQGKVLEKGSQESLIGASVYALGAKQGIVTNDFGQFSLKIQSGSYRFVASYVGYRPDTVLVNLRKDTVVNFTLTPVLFSEVVVKGDKINVRERLESTALPMAQLKAIPSLLGEADALRALTMLPGVSNGTEGSVGLNVRGGSPDQNLILIDGATIYNAAHLFGFLSAFNTDAIKRVELFKGSFPARYGGRLSSVIDITFKDGNKEKRSTEIGIGFLDSKVFVEGPIKKNKSSFMLAARTSYLDLFTAATRVRYNNNLTNKYRNYNFYDINGKLNFIIGKEGSLSVNLYRSNDFFVLAEKFSNNANESQNKLSWNSTVGNIRYSKTLSKKVFFSTQIAYNRYFYNFNIRINPTSLDAQDQLDLKYNTATTINDVSYKNIFNVKAQKNIAYSFGTEVLAQSFLPNITETVFSGVSVGAGGEQNITQRKSIGYAAFADVDVNLGAGFSTKIGLRQANYSVKDDNFHFLEPRLSLNFDVNANNSFKLSYTKMNQMIHLLSNNTVGFTNDAWIPATKLAPPQSARQYALGYVGNIPAWDSYISIESFYKQMNNLIDYSEGSNPVLNNAAKGWEQIIQKNGLGRAYGLEIMLHKELGKFNGFLEYTLSRTERRFDKINRGRWYPSRFDRTHDFGLTGSYAFTKKWSISSSFLFSTGTPFTGPEFLYIDRKGMELTGTDLQYGIELYTSAKNNLRLPDYHRLDISVTKTKTTKKETKSVGVLEHSIPIIEPILLQYRTSFMGNSILMEKTIIVLVFMGII